MNKALFARLFLSLMFAAAVVAVSSASSPLVELSEEEQLWLQNHGPIRVSNELNWAPFNFSERGTPAGFSIETMKLVAEILNIEITPISGPSWSEFLEMLERGEIDVILNIAMTPQRTENMLFSMPYSQFSLALFSRTGSPIMKDFRDLSGKTIAVPEGFWLEEILVDYPDIDILSVADAEEAIQAVSADRADALYDVMPVVQYLSKQLFITNLQIGGTLNIEGDERVDLHMAVRKDQDILHDILNKGISAISPADFARLRDQWLGSGETSTVAEQERKNDFRIPIMAILIGVVSIAVLTFLLRRVIKKVKVLNFRSIWIISIIGLIIFVALVVGLGWITIDRVNRNLREDLIDSLNVGLGATEESLAIWVDNSLRMVNRDADNINLMSMTEDLIETSGDTEERRTAFRSYITGSLRWLDEELYQIIGPDYRILLSNDMTLDGTISAIGTNAGKQLRRAFGGETVFVPTFDTAADGEEMNPRMFFLSPVRDQRGQIIAVLARAESPSRDFSRLATMGHSGWTGETFTFNSEGWLLSNSRFERQLIQIGLLTGSQDSILNIQLKDPGVNLFENEVSSLVLQEQELTYMASRAVAGFGGESIDGYRDYRGVPVFGVWHWDARRGYGIATEIDVSEGLDSFYVIRNSIIVTLAATVLLAVLVTLVSLIFGEKSNQALNESRAELEDRVDDRTRELSQANKNLNNTIEALTHPFYVIDVKTHGIILANQAAIRMGKQGASTCYSLTHFGDVPCDGKHHPCPMIEVVKNKQPVQVEHTHTDKDGNTHQAEVHGYPILDENGEVVQMIEYSLDITARKKAEETTRKHLEELERFNTLTVGREEKMIELKIDINELHKQLNLPEKYVIVTDGIKEIDGQ